MRKADLPETNGTHAVRPRRHLDRPHKPLNQRLRHTLTMLIQPRPQRHAHLRRLDPLVHNTQRLPDFQRGLCILQKLNRKSIPVEEVGDVDEEASGGVLVGKETRVGELVAEDVGDEDYGAAGGVVGGGGDVDGEACYGLFVAFGGAGLEGPAEAAGGHADVGGHC